MQAYRDSIDYMYSGNPQVIADYAAFVGVPESMARRVRDDFFPKSLVNPDEIKGLDTLMNEAVALKFISGPAHQGAIGDADPAAAADDALTPVKS